MAQGYISSTQKKRILFVLEYYYPYIGGAETLFGHLAETLVSNGYSVLVITSRLPGTKNRDSHNGVEILRVKTPPFARRYFFTIMSLPTVIREAVSADIIHTTTYNAAIPAWIAAKFRKKPAVLTVHEVFGDQWNNLPGLNPLVGYVFRAYEWFILHLPFTHYICDSQFTKDRLFRTKCNESSRGSVVYPAVDYSFWDKGRHQQRDLKRELGLNQDSFVYLYFGRPGISKGIEYLIDAATQIRNSLVNSHLVMILAKDPSGQYGKILRLIDKCGLSDHITVLNPVSRDELPSYLLAADCVVVPSVSEGFGYAAIEAATIGCPVVATSGHSVQEILEGSVVLVPSRDPSALAEGVAMVLNKKPIFKQPRRFDAESHIAGVINAYKALD